MQNNGIQTAQSEHGLREEVSRYKAAEKPAFTYIPRDVVVHRIATGECLSERLFWAIVLWSWCGPMSCPYATFKDDCGYIPTVSTENGKRPTFISTENGKTSTFLSTDNATTPPRKKRKFPFKFSTENAQPANILILLDLVNRLCPEQASQASAYRAIGYLIDSGSIAQDDAGRIEPLDEPTAPVVAPTANSETITVVGQKFSLTGVPQDRRQELMDALGLIAREHNTDLTNLRSRDRKRAELAISTAAIKEEKKNIKIEESSVSQSRVHSEAEERQTDPLTNSPSKPDPTTLPMPDDAEKIANILLEELGDRFPSETPGRTLCLQIVETLKDAPYERFREKIHSHKWKHGDSMGLALALAGDVRQRWLQDSQKMRKAEQTAKAAEEAAAVEQSAEEAQEQARIEAEKRWDELPAEVRAERTAKIAARGKVIYGRLQSPAQRAATLEQAAKSQFADEMISELKSR